MPIIGRPRGYENEIGRGGEKVVFGASDPTVETDDHRLVVKKTRDEYYERLPYFENEKNTVFVKAQFYLTKIIHLLFPKNFPDIYYESVKDGTKLSVNQRIDNRIKDKAQMPDIYKDKNALVNLLSGVIIAYDKVSQNFEYDNDGNLIYVDSINPWDKYDNQSNKKNYHPDKIQEAIAKIIDKRDREAAEHYFTRLEKLFDEEQSRLQG